MWKTVYLKTACERCSGHIEYPTELAGQSVECPHCHHTITLPQSPPVPPQSRPKPPPVPSFPQPSVSLEKSTRTSSKRFGCIGTIGTIDAIAAVALATWFVNDSSKPQLLAKVQVTSKTLRITNCNDTIWDSPAIILNDGFAGPILDLHGSWAPKETRELSLDDFRGLNHQAFKPGYEDVRKVLIQARGFQLGIYETRLSHLGAGKN